MGLPLGSRATSSRLTGRGAVGVCALNAAKAAPIGHSQLESDLPGWFRDWEKTPQGQYSLLDEPMYILIAMTQIRAA